MSNHSLIDRVLSIDPFTWQRWILDHLPPLTNDRIHTICVALAGIETAIALLVSSQLSPGAAVGVAVFGYLLFFVTFALLLLLAFAADALPGHYGKIVDVRERMDPITGAGLAWLLVALLVTHANVFAVLLRIDPYALGESYPSGYLDVLYFSVVTAFTIGYGELAPTGSVGKLLVIAEAFSSAMLLIGFVGVVVSTYVGVLERRRAYMLSVYERRRTKEEDQPAQEKPSSLEGSDPESSDQGGGKRDDEFTERTP